VAEAILVARGTKGQAATPYGDGRAAEKIAEALERTVDRAEKTIDHRL